MAIRRQRLRCALSPTPSRYGTRSTVGSSLVNGNSRKHDQLDERRRITDIQILYRTTSSTVQCPPAVASS